MSETVKVLVVDDHVMFAQALARALRDESGVEVCATAGSVAEAIDAAREHAPDVVLMDYDLPDGTGTAATRAMRDVTPHAKVVMVTSFDDEQVLVEAIEAGCAGFVPKHKAVEEVVAAVRATAAGEALISPSMLARLLPRLKRSYKPAGTDLTRREQEILALIASGLPNQAIAEKLVISPHTVRNHVQNLLTKLNAHSKLEAVATAAREGLIHF